MPSCKVDPGIFALLAFQVRVETSFDLRQPESVQELLCAINVAHNCAANGCKPTTTRPMVQERETRADKFEDELRHLIEPDDCFLNLAQLRSSTHVQQFRSQRLSRPLTEVIEDAIRNKSQLDSEARAAQIEKEADRSTKAQERQAKAAQKANPSRSRTALPPPPQNLSTVLDPAGEGSHTASGLLAEVPAAGQKRGRSESTLVNTDIPPVTRRRQTGSRTNGSDSVSSYQNLQWVHYEPHV